jgi:hypothetical protein
MGTFPGDLVCLQQMRKRLQLTKAVSLRSLSRLWMSRLWMSRLWMSRLWMLRVNVMRLWEEALRRN